MMGAFPFFENEITVIHDTFNIDRGEIMAGFDNRPFDE